MSIGKSEVKPPYWTCWALFLAGFACVLTSVPELALIPLGAACRLLHMAIDCIESIPKETP